MPEKESRSPALLRSFSTLLMITLVICFAAQEIVIVRLEKPYDAYIGLSGYGMKSWHLWELFTYQFLHCGLVHLLLNLAGLWFLGRAAEGLFGARRFLLFYLVALLAGGLLQGLVGLTGFLLPESMESVAAILRDRFGGPVAGSSVGLCGILAALCLTNTGERRFVLPFLPIKGVWVWWIAVGIAVALIVIPSNPSLAHVAHLGGLLAGAVSVKLVARSGQVES